MTVGHVHGINLLVKLLHYGEVNLMVLLLLEKKWMKLNSVMDAMVSNILEKKQCMMGELESIPS